MLSVRTKVNKTLYDGLIADFPKLNMTSVSQIVPTQFPTLNVNSLGEIQTADDLEMTEQNAIYSTIELKAYSNTKLSEARNILDKAGDIMLSMHYQLTMGVEVLQDSAPFCVVARFRRFIGSNDSIFD